MQIEAICIGQAEKTPAKSGLTGHFKVPQSGDIRIDQLGLSGDTIVDTDHHGGPDQAVYLFGGRDRVWWADTLARDTPPGYFGENLSISDLCSTHLALGDVFQIGAVRLQITSPRIPCATFAAHVGDPSVIKTFFRAQRPGAYARVLQPGSLRVGDPVVHIPFDGPQITLAENMDAFVSKTNDPAYLRRLLQTPAHEKGLAEARAALDALDG